MYLCSLIDGTPEVEEIKCKEFLTSIIKTLRNIMTDYLYRKDLWMLAIFHVFIHTDNKL
jgi:hypothetical protein